MREILESVYRADTTLVESGGGVFDISVDGVIAFSKKKEQRFPNKNDLKNLVSS